MSASDAAQGVDGAAGGRDRLTSGATDDDGLLTAMYTQMLRIRRFEERVSRLYRAGEIPGFVHLALGQEATAVGACYHLRARDVITSTHRGHGHALARGLSPFEVFAELMGREGGVCRGRGGSMHIADPERGIFGANGIVGAGIPIATGAALAAELRHQDAVAMAFLGDGAISTGAFHEGANLASLWQLPLILFCENNGYSEFSRFEDQHPVPIQDRALAYGLKFREADGGDVAAIASLMRDVLEDVRADGSPYLIEARTRRIAGHYEGDPQLYRESDDERDSSAWDPLARTRTQLLELGVDEASVERIAEEIDVEIDEACEQALHAPHPDPGEVADDVIVVREHVQQDGLESVSEGGEESWKYFEAIRAALEAELKTDPDVFLAGIDVGKGGNVFGITRGLHERWPERVRDTPIAETAIIGSAVGAAMAGMKPVVELMYFDFLGVCLDQIMNQAAKLRYMTGGKATLPLTIRTQCGAGRASGAQHSQSLEALLAHIPGLTVVMPGTPSDAYGLLRTSIQDPNPVVFVENRNLYGMRGPGCESDHHVPIGRAAVRREGSDVTVVSYSRMAQVCLEAVGLLEDRGVSTELIDLRTIAPLDSDSVVTSVKKTNRLVIVHEAARDFGVGAELAARMADEAVWHLDAPIVRVAPAHVPAPYSPRLEAAWLPDLERVVSAVERVAWI